MKHEAAWEDFIELVLNCDSKQDLILLFETFLTISEREAIASRHAIIKELLTKPDTHRNLAKSLEVSLANVTRASNLLKIKGKEIKELFNT